MQVAGVNDRGVEERCSTRKLVWAKFLPKHGGRSRPQVCATAGAGSTSPSENEGLRFAKCVRGLGVVEEEGKGKERFGW